MENIPTEYIKLLDETKKHLTLQTLATYINLPEQLSEKEREFISDHLSTCRQCMGSFEHLFDEDLELEENKNVIILSRQNGNKDEEAAVFRSEDSLMEIELTRLSGTDFNLRFASIPSLLKGKKGALRVNQKYLLRVLFMNIDTMFIIHSEEDIMNLGSFELVCIMAPFEVSSVPKPSTEQNRPIKYYRYAAAVIAVIAAAALIYYAVNSGNRPQNQNEQPQVMTDLTPGGKPIRESDTATTKPSQPSAKNVPENNQQTVTGTDSFSANEKLENIIKHNNSSDSQVEIISPSLGADIKMPITFQWMTARKNITLRFVILTNQSVPVYNSLINGQELTIDTKLDPGLYYWELESSNNIEAMGKFFIR